MGKFELAPAIDVQLETVSVHPMTKQKTALPARLQPMIPPQVQSWRRNHRIPTFGSSCDLTEAASCVPNAVNILMYYFSSR
jgi:hypothetical protein